MNKKLLAHFSAGLLLAGSLCLSSCITILHGVDPEDFSAKNKESLKQVAPFLIDTAALVTYEFDKRERIGNIGFADDSFDQNLHHYTIGYFSTGQLQSVTYLNARHSYSRTTEFLRSGKISKEYEDSLYAKVKSNYWQGLHYRYYAESNGMQYVFIKQDYFLGNRYSETKFFDNGAVMEITNYYKGYPDGESTGFYRNGILKTRIVFSNRKIVSATEYEPDGSKVLETNVENSNGHWLTCNSDGNGGFCCECYVVNGVVKHSKSLKAAKNGRTE